MEIMRFLSTVGKFAGKRLTYAKLIDLDGGDSSNSTANGVEEDSCSSTAGDRN